MDNQLLPVILAMMGGGGGGGKREDGSSSWTAWWTHIACMLTTVVLARIVGSHAARTFAKETSEAVIVFVASFLSSVRQGSRWWPYEMRSVTELHGSFSVRGSDFDGCIVTHEFRAVAWRLFETMKAAGTPMRVMTFVTDRRSQRGGGGGGIGTGREDVESFAVPLPRENGGKLRLRSTKKEGARDQSAIDARITWSSNAEVDRFGSAIVTNSCTIHLGGVYEVIDAYVRACVADYTEESQKTKVSSFVARLTEVTPGRSPVYTLYPRVPSELSLHTRVKGTATAMLAGICERHARGFPKMVRFGQSESTAMLFHGAPGTGKTTAILKYAKHLELMLGKDVYIMIVDASMVTKVETLREIVMSNSYNGMYIPPEQVVLVFEEIDCGVWGDILRRRDGGAPPSRRQARKKGRKTRKTKATAPAAAPHMDGVVVDGGDHEDDERGGGGGEEKDTESAFDKELALSDFLEIMDGLQKRPRKTIIATTNHPDHLDPAICRPGRFGTPIEFGPLKTEEVCEMYEGWHDGELLPAEVVRLVRDGAFTQAEVGRLLQMYQGDEREDREALFTELTEGRWNSG